MNSIRRLELKYYFHTDDLRDIKNYLNASMITDPNDQSEDGYKITSLYFDTIDDDDLNQKLDGIIYREKYRVRIYNDNCKSGKFEIKRKLNNCIEKISIDLFEKEIREIINGNYSFLDNFENTAYVSSRMKYLSYKPKTIVSYHRKAYFLPINNIRITLDTSLCTYGFETDLFKVGGMVPVSIQKNGYQILEIKYEDYIPEYITDFLKSKSTVRSSISKYALSRVENNTEIFGDDPLIPH